MSKSVTVNTPEELGKVLLFSEVFVGEIRIEGDLAETVVSLRDVSPLQWIGVYASFAGAIAAVMSGVLLFAAIPAATVAIALLGHTDVVKAVRIGVAAKDPGALPRLRKDFVTVERGRDYLVLKRK